MLKQLIKASKILDSLKDNKTIKGYCLIGGLALAYWGNPRATRDIDMLVLVDTDKRDALCDAFRAYDKDTELRKGGPLDPVPCLIKTSIDRIDVDIICVSKTWELEAIKTAEPVTVDNHVMPFVDPCHMIILKLKAGGPQDIIDVQNMITYSGDYIDREKLQELADQFKVAKKLHRLLSKGKSHTGHLNM